MVLIMSFALLGNYYYSTLILLHQWLGKDFCKTTATTTAALQHHLGAFFKGLMSLSDMQAGVLAGDTEGQRLVSTDIMPREIHGCAAGQVRHLDLAISIPYTAKPWRMNATPT